MIKERINRVGILISIIFLLVYSILIPSGVGVNIKYIVNNQISDIEFYQDEKFGSYKPSIYQEYIIEEDANNRLKLYQKPHQVEKIRMEFLGPMDSPWPMKSHDNHHTSQSPYITENTTSLEKWRFACNWVEESAVIDNDGILYFGTWGWYIHALYPNGTEKWKYHTGNIITSAPAIAEDGTIYIGSWDTKVYAINPNGTLKWKTVGTGGSISSSPAISNDGTIYIGNLENKIVAIYNNGTIKWTYNTGYKISSDPAIGDDGTIYIGSGDKYLYAMNPNGTLKWRFKTGDEVHSHPSIGSDGTIYFGSNDKKLYALYPNGTLKWDFSIPSGLYNSASIGEDGTIYVADDYLYAIYPNGTVKWKFNYGSDRWVSASSPAISSEGIIYVGTHIGNMVGGDIVAVNPDGTEHWKKMIADEWVDGSPCIGPDGIVYIGSSCDGPGYLHAFGPVESNNPPNAPVLSGKNNGKVGDELWYGIRSLDPDNNPVRFYVEWGDGTNTGWTRDFASNEKYYLSHKYSAEGVYTIRAKAKDTLDEESGWGTYNVTITKKSKEITNSFIRYFLERYPLLYRLLNLI